MKQKTLSLLFLFLCGMAFTACEETTEPTAYDNWRERNDAFIDSIRTETGENYLVWRNPATRVTTDLGQTDMVLGDLYAVEVQDGNTTAGLQYAYCKKLVDNPDGERLLYTDNVSAYLHCTNIIGASVITNFEGFTALDSEILLDESEMKWPTPFDEPANISISSDARVPQGLRWVLQLMRVGERWMVYVPYSSYVGYGESDTSISYSDNGSSYSSSTILGCSVLAYDIIVNDLL